MDINRIGAGNSAGAGHLGRPAQAGGRDEAGEAGASTAGVEQQGKQIEAGGGQAAAQGVSAAGQVDSFCQCPGSTREAQECNAHNSVDKVAQFQRANAA